MTEEREPTKDICRRQNWYYFYYQYYNYEVNNFFTTAIKPMKCNIDKKKTKNIYLFRWSYKKEFCNFDKDYDHT